jgi:hypothetical protein
MNGKMRLTALLILAVTALAPANAFAQLQVDQPYCVDTDAKKRVSEDGRRSACQIGDRVRAPVTGLGAWLEDGENQLANLVLSVDGSVLTGVTASHLLVSCNPKTDKKCEGAATTGTDGVGLREKEYLQFGLIQTADNNKDWERVLMRYKVYAPKIVALSVVDSRTETVFGGETIELEVASQVRAWSLIILYVVLAIFAGYGVSKWGFLREPGPKPTEGTRPFSLGATQMAFWFFVIVAGYIYLWIVTGQTDTLTESVLGLAGISAGTGLAAVAVGASTLRSNAAKRTSLNAEIKEVEARLKEIEGAVAASPPPSASVTAALETEQGTKKTRRTELKAEIAALPPPPKPRKSQGFFRDLMVSEGEVSFSRFQMFAWTIVLGVIFIHSVFTTLAMPDFGVTLLGLMGISSGTYVGFKFPQAPGN